MHREVDMTEQEDIISRIKGIYHSMQDDEKQILRKILEEFASTGRSTTYEDVWLADYKEIPVSKKVFLTSPRYLGNTNDNGRSIYPAWMDVMLELERTGNQYTEIVLTGATRTGKSTTAVSDASYQLYRLMCLRDPHAYFNIKTTTTLSIFFFNLTKDLARGVCFKEFNTTLKMSPWFQEHGHMTNSETNPIYIPEGGNIEISYGSDSSHALGRATFAVIFDEVNFSGAGIKDINKAKARMKAKYDTLVARVTGTFVRHGEVYGRLYVISSKNSDSDFMEDYIAAQKRANNPHMYIFDKPQWEVWPSSKYSSDKTFKIALGGRHLKSFVVPDNQMDPTSLAELTDQGYRLLDVPEDNKTRFLSDFDIALRDIAGISVVGSMSFFTQEMITECISQDRRNPFYHDILQIGTKDTYEISEFFHIEEIEDKYKRMPMFIHLDLSLNTDKTGISGVVVSGREDTEVDGRTVSDLKFTHIFSLSLEAPRGDKIPYSKITRFICWLRSQHFNIDGISRDQFQSEYMGQLLEEQGFTVDKISLDRTPDGYIALRSVLLDKRIDMLDIQILQDELVLLQRDSTSGKLDHPVGGSKDVSDSFAGAVWNAMLKNPKIPIPVKNVASAISSINMPRNRGTPQLPSMFPGLNKR